MVINSMFRHFIVFFNFSLHASSSLEIYISIGGIFAKNEYLQSTAKNNQTNLRNLLWEYDTATNYL